MSRTRSHTRGALGATVVFVVLLSAFYLLVSFSGRSPVIDRIEPVAAEPGETVVIRGSHFGETRGRSKVRLAGSVPTSSAYREWTDSRIVLEVPEDTTSGLAYVETERGRSNGVLFANAEHIPQGDAGSDSSARPALTAVEPQSAAVGDVITIRGNRFGTNRSGARVTFAWRSAEGRTGRIRVSADEQEYQYWSAREIRVRVPDGAVSGPVAVETARGASEGLPIEIARPVGEKRFLAGRSHAVVLSATVDSVTLSPDGSSGTLYLWAPRIDESAEQRNYEVLTESQAPLFSRPEGVDLYRVTDPAPDTVWHFRRSVLFDRYAVETDITTEAVPYEYERSETFLRRYTQPNVLLPVDGPVVQETAAALLRTARNPYVLAFRTYEWVLGNLDPVDQVGAVGAEQALSTGRANAHGYAMATVSLLRAMEIPARPVGGFLVLDDGSIRRHYWGEFYLEDFGWVPLDPAAADGAVPGAFRRPEDPAGYYFGNLDARRFDFTKGVIAIPRMHPEGRTRRLETAYSLQSHHEEAVGDISWYRSLWHDVEYLGEY